MLEAQRAENLAEDTHAVQEVLDLGVLTVHDREVLAREARDLRVTGRTPEAGLPADQVPEVLALTGRVVFVRLRSDDASLHRLVRVRGRSRQFVHGRIQRRSWLRVRVLYQPVLDRDHPRYRDRVRRRPRHNLLRDIRKIIRQLKKKKRKFDARKNTTAGYRKIHEFQIRYH